MSTLEHQLALPLGTRVTAIAGFTPDGPIRTQHLRFFRSPAGGPLVRERAAEKKNGWKWSLVAKWAVADGATVPTGPVWDALSALHATAEREVDVIHTSAGVLVRYVVALVLEEREQAEQPTLGGLSDARQKALSDFVQGPTDLVVAVQKGSIGGVEWTFESIRAGVVEVGVELSSKKVAPLLAQTKVSLADIAFG